MFGQSPVCTPSVLHGSLPPWAQHTPSPSPAHRVGHRPSFCMDQSDMSPVSKVSELTLAPPSLASPSVASLFVASPLWASDAAAQAAQTRVSEGAGVATLVTKELLWTVCAPFMDQMMTELQRAVQAKFEAVAVAPLARIPAARRQDLGGAAAPRGPRPRPRARRLSLAPSGLSTTSAGAFVASVETSRCGESEEAEAVFHLTETTCTVESGSFELFDGDDSRSAVEWQDAATGEFTCPPAKALSFGIEAATQGAWPQPILGRAVTRPAAPMEIERLSGGPAPAALHLWALGAPAVAVAAQVAAAYAARAGDAGPSLLREFDGATSPMKGLAMVCHHWKSKGWCRMAERCKFLHLEDKRGTGPTTKPPKGSWSRGRSLNRLRGPCEAPAGRPARAVVTLADGLPQTGSFFPACAGAKPMPLRLDLFRGTALMQPHKEGYFVMAPGF